MIYRRAFCCGALTCLMALSPTVVWADAGRHDNVGSAECDDASEAGHDGHTAGERDSAHEHDRREIESSTAGEMEDDDEATSDDDDCVVAPPAEVAEAPKALLLSTSAALTGGAAVFVIRRRSRSSKTPQRAT